MLRLLPVFLLLSACSRRPNVTPERTVPLDCVDGCLSRATMCLDWSASDTRWLWPFGPGVFWDGDSPDVYAEACRVDLRRCERICERNPKAIERALDVTPRLPAAPPRAVAAVDGGVP